MAVAERRDEPMSEDGQPAEWSDERRRELRHALEELRRRQMVATTVFAGAVLAVVASGVLLHVPEEWWMPAVGIVALAALVFRLVNWKCPACGERLPTRRSPDACPGCGLPLG
jgi:rubrerythrin